MTLLPHHSQSPSVHIFAKVAIWAAFVVSVCCFAFLAWVWSYSVTVTPSQPQERVVVHIPKGASVQQIGSILAAAGLLRDDIRLRIIARYYGYAHRLPAGEFSLARGKTPPQVLEELVSARPVKYEITLPEGLTVSEIGRLFADRNWCSHEEFIGLAHDPAFIESLGFGALDSLEGYLFPDTYYLTRRDFSAKRLVQLLVGRFSRVWEEVAKLPPSHDMSRHDIITLASIVEKETGVPEERPLIATVFHNRLKRNMRLQSDPTVIYGIEDFDGNITREHLRAETPYNTYVIPGLPKGPICNPGRDAMVAVVQPAVGNVLYFVSKNNGTHHFSKNIREHNRAVNTYQRRRVKAKAVEQISEK